MNKNNFNLNWFEKVRICINCGSQNFSKNYLKIKYEFFRINICSQCGLAQTNPRIKKKYLHKLYNDKYLQSHYDTNLKKSSKFATIKKLIDLSIKSIRQFKLRLLITNMIKKKLVKTSSVVLDFGCGDGVFLEVLQDIIPNSYGADFKKWNEIEKILNFISYNKLNKKKYSNFFDAIILRHVLEHTVNPNELLLNLKILLKDNGQFIIEVPNFDSFWIKIFKSNYDLLYLPYHTFHFNSSTIKTTLKDFNVTEIYSSDIPIIALSIARYFKITIRQLGLLTAIFYPFQIFTDKLLNNHTAITIIVKPKN